MDSKILFGLVSLLIISSGTAFAQESLVSVQTDDNHYDEGDTVVISGQAGEVLTGAAVFSFVFGSEVGHVSSNSHLSP